MSQAATPPDTSSVQYSVRQTKNNTLSIALMGLLLLAFFLRIFLLDGQSIWWDEGISFHLATSDLATLVTDRLDNIHPPLYFILLKGWIGLTGLSVFSARYLSALAGWLLVALTYSVGARWFGRRTGLAAAFLCTISAVSVIYAQEIRVYSLLPLAYLGLLAITRELTRQDAPSSRKGWILWAALGIVSWIALHLHYVSLFAVGYVTLWAGFSYLRGRRWGEFWRLAIVQFLVLLASLPWFSAALFNWRAISGEANAGTFVTEAVPLRFLLAQVWTFHLTGLAGALSRPGIETVAGITALFLLLLLFLRLIDRRTRRSTAVLLAHWLIPLSSALLVWLVRSFSHPRYVAMFVPGLIMLAAYLILPNAVHSKPGPFRTLSRAIALILLSLLTALSLWGLALYYFDEQVAKDDIRAIARFLEDAAGAEDLILVPDTDWSLPFEYRGPARVAMPGLENEADYWVHLAELTAGAPRVFVLDYERGTRDWQNIVPFALHSSGTLDADIKLDDLLLRIYDLQQPVSAPDYEPLAEQFGPLRLEGTWIEQEAPAGDALAVALQWHLVEGEGQPPANVTLRLLDENGSGRAGARILSTTDDRLLDRSGRPSDQWTPAETVTTFHLLPLPPATPPLEYTIAVEVYEEDAGQIRPFDLLDDQGAPKGQKVLIRQVQTARGDLSAEEIALPNTSLPEAVEFNQGLILHDAAISSLEVSAGRPLTVGLLWQADKALPDLRPRLLLVQNGDILAAVDSAPSDGRYPTSLWQVGEQVYEERDLLLPPGSAGRAELVLDLDDQMVRLAEISIRAQDFIFTRPHMDHELDIEFGDVARLVGFDLEEGAYSTAEMVPLTLLWESLRDGGAEDYVVFTHLLADDGRLIGQHDGAPGQGERPVSGWVQGEYILDPHEMVFRDPAYEGVVRVEVGLYDPQSGERVKQPDGSDHFLLPVELVIEKSE